MHRLILISAVLLAGCTSAPEPEVEPPAGRLQEFSRNPELREAQATMALMDAVGDATAGKKDFYLKGTCEVSLPGSQLTRPCPNLTVTAADPSGEEVGKAVVERGKFSIRVPRMEDYFLTLTHKDENYLGDKADPLGPFRPEDSILIRVNRTPQ